MRVLLSSVDMVLPPPEALRQGIHIKDWERSIAFVTKGFAAKTRPKPFRRGWHQAPGRSGRPLRDSEGATITEMPRRAELIAEMYRDSKSPRARELREAAGLSQSETAEIIGTTSATLRRWEEGER